MKTIAITKTSGRKMHVVEEMPKGLVRVTVAKGDPEYQQWHFRKASVIWPREWVYLPGDQMDLALNLQAL
jgi:hypothetical protein